MSWLMAVDIPQNRVYQVLANVNAVFPQGNQVRLDFREPAGFFRPAQNPQSADAGNAEAFRYPPCLGVVQ